MNEQFDAWSEAESALTTQPPQARSSRTTGLYLIVGIFVMLICLLGLFVAYNFGVVRPMQATIIGGTATAYAEATAQKQHDLNRRATAHAVATIQKQATADYSSTLAAVPAGWETLLDERFDIPDRWFTGPTESRYGTSDVTISDGRLYWKVRGGEGIFIYRTPDMDIGHEVTLKDFEVSVETTVIDNDGSGGSYGVVFRESGSLWYMFRVSQDDQFSVYYHGLDGWESIISWRKLPDYVGSPPYKLTVRGEGSKFLFFVNDQYVESMDDNRILRGFVGIGMDVSSYHVLEVEFDNLKISRPVPPLRTPYPTPSPRPTQED